MGLNDWGRERKTLFACPVCGEKVEGIGSTVAVCPRCIRENWQGSRRFVENVHMESRRLFRLPPFPPAVPGGVACDLCLQQCRMGETDRGYCDVRSGSAESMREDGRTRARLSSYYDPLPTNCVADWVCAGGTGSGYPEFAHVKGTEVGYYNLAVFFEACNFNCLYCQNWSFKEPGRKSAAWTTVDGLARAVNTQTSCICFFGGDPTPQLPFALRVSEKLRRGWSGKILRICWETNGSMHPEQLKRMASVSLESGGTIKIDLKAWNPHIHQALCGCDNQRVLENFSMLARWVPERPDPPLLVASTLLVPGYVEAEEVKNIAEFIARLNPDIPYALLGFAPQFCLDDFPTTSRVQAESCLDAARQAGLRRIRLGNHHLIGARS
ncbi:MAG: radical SAM protein [Deltaproteobacteria bacterium]|nr:radical SAM protein [Deltaproteobacteria bacterium]